MSLAKYRCDTKEAQPDGAIVWRAQWIGGPSLSKVENCRAVGLAGTPRVTAYVQGEPDTFFSIPAKCHYRGVTMNGYLSVDDDTESEYYGAHCLVFHHCFY